jgi:hypothetical protein
MVVVGKAFQDEHDVFYDYQEEFIVWETILLCVWSFSTHCSFQVKTCNKEPKGLFWKRIASPFFHK